MSRTRLDQELVRRGLVASRSQAESYIRLGEVTVNGKVVVSSEYFVAPEAEIVLGVKEQYVSRAALKLGSVAQTLGVDFNGKTVLDIGSSTGGFTQYALAHGAKKVIAVEVGTNQLHPSLRGDPRIELFEQTDFRTFYTDTKIDVVVADVSFISLREILPNAHRLGNRQTTYIVMVKPQFEAGDSFKNKGIIKNDRMRRDILKDFERWAAATFVIKDKADSDIAGARGNRERFYMLTRR